MHLISRGRVKSYIKAHFLESEGEPWKLACSDEFISMEVVNSWLWKDVISLRVDKDGVPIEVGSSKHFFRVY